MGNPMRFGRAHWVDFAGESFRAWVENSQAETHFTIRWCQAAVISLKICGKLRVSFHWG
jgi:hypothetical protein